MRDRGTFTVRVIDDAIVECVARGHMVLEHVLAAQAELEAVLHSDKRRWQALFDAYDVESFEPGLPIRWVRWGALNAHRAERVAIVARPGPMLSIGRTFQVLLPASEIALFADRRAALVHVAVRSGEYSTMRETSRRKAR